MNYEDKKKLVFKYLVNKMLKPHGVDYDYVMANQKIDGEDWFCYYQWTVEEQNTFQKEAVDYIRKTLKKTKNEAGKIAAWFILGYGLKCSDYNLNKKTNE